MDADGPKCPVTRTEQCCDDIWRCCAASSFPFTRRGELNWQRILRSQMTSSRVACNGERLQEELPGGQDRMSPGQDARCLKTTCTEDTWRQTIVCSWRGLMGWMWRTVHGVLHFPSWVKEETHLWERLLFISWRCNNRFCCPAFVSLAKLNDRLTQLHRENNYIRKYHNNEQWQNNNSQRRSHLMMVEVLEGQFIMMKMFLLNPTDVRPY